MALRVGIFVSPPPTARPVPANYTGRAKSDNPPGFYGPPEGLLAVNTLAPADRLAPLDFTPLAQRDAATSTAPVEPQDLRGPILLAALALFLLDTVVVLFLGGGIQRLIPRFSRATAATAILFAVLALTLTHAHADDVRVGNVPASALETKLAYVVTGNAEVDAISKAGLAGLTLFLAQRTALRARRPDSASTSRATSWRFIR